ncbi:MAG TPA: ABC transporter permease [Caproiciproducens sp.]|nr:ABC transporter permease [Caproiciproducens sp.]
MFYNLAFKNVSKSIRDYTVYFLTLTFGVCLFYMFNSMDSQTAMLNLKSSQYESVKAMTEAIAYVSVFISVILGFLIVYANQFLIKRRKKELGVYMTLGMEKGKISRILILETFFIGIFALVVGLLVGVFASQGLSVVTAKMFEVSLKAFLFTFSIKAFYKTLIYFSIIFVIVMIFNTVSISKLKLIDLLTAGKKNENLKIKRLWISVVLFLVAVVCLGFAYYFINKNGMLMWNAMFAASIILGCIGTLLFFFSLSGFLLRVVQSNKRLYFKNMNMFVLRQINSKINTTFVSMTCICIMLLITIGTLSTGIGLANTLSDSVRKSTPYDITFSYESRKDGPERSYIDLVKALAKDNIDLNRYAKDYVQLNIYTSDLDYGGLKLDDSNIRQSYGDEVADGFKKTPIPVIALSEYNKAAQMQGKPTLALKENEFAVNCTMEQFQLGLEAFCRGEGKITLNGKQLTCASKTFSQTALMTSMSQTDSGTVIVPDALVKGLKFYGAALNVNYKSSAVDAEFRQLLDTVYGSKSAKSKSCPYDMALSKSRIYEQGAGLRTAVCYIAIYIGLVFLITSAAVLALQQLSEASDNTERYSLLRKLGTDEKMINRALFGQIGIYFFIPLSLAIVHSIVGIRVANNVVAILGHIDIVGNSVFTAAIFLLIYGGYFLATYFGSKSMIQQRQNG